MLPFVPPKQGCGLPHGDVWHPAPEPIRCPFVWGWHAGGLQPFPHSKSTSTSSEQESQSPSCLSGLAFTSLTRQALPVKRAGADSSHFPLKPHMRASPGGPLEPPSPSSTSPAPLTLNAHGVRPGAAPTPQLEPPRPGAEALLS